MNQERQHRSIAVIGGGSWGSTLAHHLAGCGHGVSLWVHEPDLASEITEKHRNSLYLPGITLHRSVRAGSDLAAVLAGADLALFVTPSHVAREVLRRALPALSPTAPVVVASKGIETDSLKTMSEVFEEEIPESRHPLLAFLSGPSFAREVARGLPTAVAAASRSPRTALLVQQVFSSDTFRVYTNADVTGVELGGALKNVIAIAAGISDGLGLGHNSRSALITRGLAEITRLGVVLGAEARTFSGLAGLGDLVLTCTGDLSRNRTVGMELGRGKPIGDILGGMQMVAEGVRTTLATVRLARRHGVEMPIAEQIHDVLYAGKEPRQALHELMTRDLTSEFERESPGPP